MMDPFLHIIWFYFIWKWLSLARKDRCHKHDAKRNEKCTFGSSYDISPGNNSDKLSTESFRYNELPTPLRQETVKLKPILQSHKDGYCRCYYRSLHCHTDDEPKRHPHQVIPPKQLSVRSSKSSIPQSPFRSFTITIRPATHVDLPRIVDIAITSFPFDPQWPYRFPYRHAHPEEHYKHTNSHYSQYLDSAYNNLNTIFLAEGPSLEDYSKREVIAVSIWDKYLPSNIKSSIKASTPVRTPPPLSTTRLDASPSRLSVWSSTTTSARKSLFYDKYGHRQMSLRQMFTAKEHWGRGAATMLVKWGMEEAEKHGIAIPMFASPMGKRVYERLGFWEVKKIVVHVAGEEESVSVAAMVWEPESMVL